MIGEMNLQEKGMNVDYKLIGSRIKEARKSRGMTQEVMAEQLDVTIGYVSQVERGITKISLDLLGKVSAILDVDIAYFVADSCVHRDTYMIDEIMSDLQKLDERDRRVILSLIKIMLNNKQ